MNENSVVVTREPPQSAVFILMGLLPCFMTFVALKSTYNSFKSQSGIDSGFWILLLGLIFCAPLAFYYFWFGFQKKKIMEINDFGITNSKGKLTKWADILEIQTINYPGPRMRFYKIKVISNIVEEGNTKIVFSSDIKPDWDKISEVLTSYTIMYNIQIIC